MSQSEEVKAGMIEGAFGEGAVLSVGGLLVVEKLEGGIDVGGDKLHGL